MKKKILSFVLAGFIVLGLTGCGKPKVFKYMEKLEPSQSLEEMNKIIGFEGTLRSDENSYKTYEWKISDDTSISAQFMLNYKTATITANYPSTMASHKANFKKWDEIKSKLNKKETITYKEFVKLVGGANGTIKQKTSDTTSYTWYNADGGYLTAYFSTETGKCTMATGGF